MLNRFLEFEEEHNLFEKCIQGVPFWPFIRFELYREIVTKQHNLGDVHSKDVGKISKKIVDKVTQLPDFFTKNPLWNLEKKDILIFNHSRRIKRDGFYECPFTDDLAKSLSLSYYVMEKPYLKKHYKPVHTKNLRYLENIFYLGIFKKRAVQKKFVLSRDEESFVDSIITGCSKEFGVNLSQRHWLKKIQYIIFDYYYRYDCYYSIVEQVNPKAIIQVVSYTFENIMFNMIAHKKQIPVIEIQHGPMRKYLPYVYKGRRQYAHFPDYLFCFGEYWKDENRLPIANEKIKVTGASYFEKRRKKLRDHKIMSDHKVILFLSQGMIGKELSQIALALAEKLDHQRFKIIYKLHPGEYDRWKSEYPWLTDAPFDIVDDNEFDLYHYLKLADFQVGVGSIALFEGLGFHLRTFIYKAYGTEWSEALYENGYATLFTSVEELYQGLSTKEKRIQPRYFWEDNSINNMVSEVEGIISNHHN